MRDRLLRIVATEHAGPHAIGIIDETSDTKKGDKTPGVQKQWCGRLGKTESRMVAVHLGFASGDFHSHLDGDQYLPESWDSERDRCREPLAVDSGVPKATPRIPAQARLVRGSIHVIRSSRCRSR